MRRLVFFVALAAGAASGQPRVVTGDVTDAVTGDPLGAVNIAVVGADGAVLGGTSTNAEGAFSLRLGAVPATLAVRFLGYETARLVVTDSVSSPLHVVLSPDAQALGEVVVRAGENPAVTLMRRVIYKTRLARDRLGPYAVTVYARSTIRGPEQDVVGIVEAVSDAYWSPTDGWREVIVGARETNNLGDGAGAAGSVAEGLVDLLATDVEVVGHRLVGPTHPDALSVYDVLITREGSLDGKRVVEVMLTPFRRTASAFEGTLQVLVETADVLSADLRPGPSFLFPPPLHVEGVRFRQQYVPVSADSSLWLPSDLRSRFGVGIEVDALLRAEPLWVERAAQFSSYRLGVSAPDSMREGSPVRRAPGLDAGRLGAAGVAVPLTDDEAGAYAAGDSLRSPEEALVLSGPLAPLARRNIRVSAASQPDSASGPPPFLDVGLAPRAQANPAEQVRLGAALALRLGALRLAPSAAYRLADGGVSLGGTGRLPVARVPAGPDGEAAISVVAEAADDVQRRTAPSAPALIGGLAGGRGGYYASRRISAGLAVSARDLGAVSGGAFATFGVEAEAALRFVAETARTYDLDGPVPADLDSDLLDLGPSGTASTVRSLRLDGAFGTLDEPLGLLPRRAVSGMLEVGPAAFGGPVFWRADIAADARVTTFGRRRALPAALDLRVAGGLSGGDLPAFRQFAVEHALGDGGLAHTAFGALRSRTDVPESGDRYALLAWEHSFRTIPFEVLGFDGLTRRSYNLIVLGAHARTWGGPLAAEAWHHEVGVSLSGVLGLFRIDLTQRLDAPGTVVGAGIARPF